MKNRLLLALAVVAVAILTAFGPQVEAAARRVYVNLGHGRSQSYSVQTEVSQTFSASCDMAQYSASYDVGLSSSCDVSAPSRREVRRAARSYDGCDASFAASCDGVSGPPRKTKVKVRH